MLGILDRDLLMLKPRFDKFVPPIGRLTMVSNHPLANSIQELFVLNNTSTPVGIVKTTVGTSASTLTMAAGIYGPVRRFNGIDGQIDLVKPSWSAGTGAMTVFGVVRCMGPENSAQSAQVILGRDGVSGARGWALYVNSPLPATFEFHVASNTTTNIFAIGTKSANYGEWHSVVGVYNPSTQMKLYVDGLDDTSGTSGTGPASQLIPNVNCMIGRRQGSTQAWNGDILLTGVANRAWSYNEARLFCIDPLALVRPISRRRRAIVPQIVTPPMNPSERFEMVGY